MKKIVSILLSIILILCIFGGCSNKESLTVENAEKYLQISVVGDAPPRSFGIDSAAKAFSVEGQINGISGYSYYDAEVTIKAQFEYSKYIEHSRIDTSRTYTKTIVKTVTLDIGGNAEISIWEDVVNERISVDGFKYEITSISGTVSPT